MIDFKAILAIARAEARLTRRLVRYWVFQTLAFIFGLLVFVYYSFIHWGVSNFSATAALINPRYLGGYLGIYYVMVFLLGLIFLGYDIRARDTRERMVEVLDALPCTNLELMLGKFLGIMIPAWIPVVFVSIFLALIGLPFGESLEPWSLITFTVAMAIPAYCFVLGLTFLVTLLLRHRLLAAVAMFAIVVGLIVYNFGFVPIHALPLVDITGGFSVPGPSDIIPGVIDMRGFMQRTGFLLMGLGLVFLAAAIHPRRDDAPRGLVAGVGALVVVAGLGLCLANFLQTRGLIEQKREWKAAHTARSEDPSPDMLALSGDVHLDPGDAMQMSLRLDFRSPRDASLDVALFSLNPGLEVSSATGAGGQSLSYTQENGLLEVSLPQPLGPGEQTAVELEIEGEPHPFFAYLDAVLDPFEIDIQEGNVFLLGFVTLINDDRYVALLPGGRWLPATGSDIGRADPNIRPQDFFALDLTVDVPDGWLVAGPGRRQPVSDGAQSGRARFRFAPPAPVPEVALVAGELESRSTEVEGVTLEVLVHPSHVPNLEFFADAAGEIEDWMRERLQEAEEVGLPYPYDALTMVEIPGMLRGYAGGWRMDTTLTQPAMILTREAGFPTARFDTPFRDPDKFRDHEGGVPRAKLEMLTRFFENDFSGGNPFVAAARNFFSYQTAGLGPDGLPLDYVWESLSTRLVTEKQGYFSIHHYGKDLNQTMGSVMGAVFTSEREDMTEVIINSITSTTEVWNAVLGVSLAELDPWEEPKRTVDVLTLKGGAMSRSLLDGLGHEKSGELLSELREKRLGDNFTRDDVIAAGQVIGEDLESWLDAWIDQTQLPGFTIDKVELQRVRDSDDGSPRYQILLTIRNDEDSPGMLKLKYRVGGTAGGGQRESSEPISVPGRSAVEVGIVTSEPPHGLQLAPYLSLNREAFNVELPPLDEERIVEADPFYDVREVPWAPAESEMIVVDDLDDLFSVDETDEGSGFRFGGRGADVDTDQGMPVHVRGTRLPGRWSRQKSSNAYGKYRHTLALVRAGSGERRAVFSADLPRSGSWVVEYYLPPRRGQTSSRSKRGTWSMTLVDSSGDNEITLDADGGEPGWNELGTFELASGEVRLEVSNETDGRYVLADAVRWRLASGSSNGAASP